LLVEQGGAVRRDWLATLVADIAARHKSGQKIIIVSSGAIALGAKRLGFEKGGRASLADAQASASVGQILLSGLWAELLGAQGLTAAQMLVTLDDLEVQVRFPSSTKMTVSRPRKSGSATTTGWRRVLRKQPERKVWFCSPMLTAYMIATLKIPTRS
jgi:glutamate 5-kinase